MNVKLFVAFAISVLVAPTSFADTYVSTGSASQNIEPRLVAAHPKAGECFYAGKPLAVGDTIRLTSLSNTQACISGPHGAILATITDDSFRMMQSSYMDANYAVSVPPQDLRPDFVPGKVWNDGQFTYIQFDNEVRELPVFLVIDGDGRPMLRNSQFHDGRIRVDGTFERGELRLGSKRVVIARL